MRSNSFRFYLRKVNHHVDWPVVKYFASIFILFFSVLLLSIFLLSDSTKKEDENSFDAENADYNKIEDIPDIENVVDNPNPEVQIPWLDKLIDAVPGSVLRFEAQVMDGEGDDGKPATHAISEQAMVDEYMKQYAFNKLVGDRTSLKRRLPDVRHTECTEIEYDIDLPAASVIIIFNNEVLSSLLRTVWSVILNSEPRLIHEIVLVDDASNETEIVEVLPEYLKHRLPKYVKLVKNDNQSGLIQARLTGAEHATGEVLIFLDSHCEATTGWIEPMLQRIKDHPNHIPMPMIDAISSRTLQFFGNPTPINPSVGSFTWSGHFSMMPLRYSSDRKVTDPAPTPTMAGGLFAVFRKFFFDIGGYDRGMIGWGGENLELSFRAWRCGGVMELMPCSHVGHIYRDFHPYFIPDDSHGFNTARMAEVWMDEYKKFFYLYRNEWATKDKGDLKERHAIKERLKCKSFRWYLDNVIPEQIIMDEEALLYGTVKNEGTQMCIDHCQTDYGNTGTPYHQKQYPCHKKATSSQYFLLSKDNEFRNEFMCGTVRKNQNDETKSVLFMEHCKIGNRLKRGRSIRGSKRTWTYTAQRQLLNEGTGLCLESPNKENAAELEMNRCISDEPRQKWLFQYSNVKLKYYN